MKNMKLGQWEFHPADDGLLRIDVTCDDDVKLSLFINAVQCRAIAEAMGSDRVYVDQDQRGRPFSVQRNKVMIGGDTHLPKVN